MIQEHHYSVYGTDCFTEDDFRMLSKIAATHRIPAYAGTPAYQAGYAIGNWIRNFVMVAGLTIRRLVCRAF